ncbi:hypothetical protein RCTITAN_49 [Rhodobacter phage RcTitan]|uniref:Uncharacterized protein n=1 Tax=Rhodobacter phage RcTitan TaxID=1662330 RepID=A0A0K1LLM3_9CAUD|nr:hypothetical protein RCTITAN_49 [Rhodobacter phage RcTitan]AKU43065.1 hypothetical protein RCTITAN_49 [Rhodobacter phage RcTitan]
MPACRKLRRITKGNLTMADEPVEARNPRIVAASNLGEDVERHYVEMSIALELKPDEAFAIPKKGFSLKLLREIAEDMSNAQKPFVVFEHDDPPVFEVRRLQPGRSAKRFYAYVGKPGIKSPLEESNSEKQTTILETISEILNGSIEEARKYEPKFTQDWKAGSVVSYSMLHKKNAGKAVFRKSAQGSTAAIKAVLTELVSEGKLYEIPEAFASQAYGSSGQLYRLFKDERNAEP